MSKTAAKATQTKATEPSRDAIDAVHLGNMQRAKADYDSATGTFRGTYAQAEKVGVNIPAAKKAMKVKKGGDKERDKFIAETRQTFRYLRLFGVRPKPEQIDFIDQDPSLIPIEEKAYDDGRLAGLLEEGTAVNPHDENGRTGKKWAEGFVQGRKERDLVLAMAMDDDDDEGEDGEDNVEPFPQAAE